MSQAPKPAGRTKDVSPDSLKDIEQVSWQQLKASTEHEATDTSFRTMTLATCTSRGADVRMVILRQVDIDHKYVWFHTDARSEKVLQLEAFPTASLLFWDSNHQVQLRQTIETRLHTDDYVADEHWEKLAAGSRKLYLSEFIPGTELANPYPGFPDDLAEKSADAERMARHNFAVIECRVLAMEYLHVGRDGQLRALFQYEPESKMTWLAP